MINISVGISEGIPYINWFAHPLCGVAVRKVSPDELLGVRIIRLHAAKMSQHEWQPKAQVVPLVYPDACLDLPAGLKEDWVQILRYVERETNDSDLEHYVDESNARFYLSLAYTGMRTKTAESHKKGTTTKKLKKPSAKHKLAGYDHAIITFGGKPIHGDTEALINFWKLVIDKTDDARLFDDDPDYSDIDPVEWGVKWRTARNQVGKLLKERLSEE